MRSKTSTEQEVFLNLLKGEIPASLDGVDTGVLFELFRRHRLFPLATVLLDQLDQLSREKWKMKIHEMTMRSLQLTSVLRTIIIGFREKGFEILPIKGPILAKSLYGDIGSRHFVDIDIMIRAESVDRILEIAGGMGYSLRFPKPGLSDRQWSYYFRYKKEIGLIHPGEDILIELHAGIDNHRLITGENEDLLWMEPVTEKIGEIEIQCMNQEWSFIYLIFHGGMHQYFRLFWLRDVAEAMERWDLNHQKILADVKLLGIERLLGVGLRLAEAYFGTKIPSEYLPYLLENDPLLVRLKIICMERIRGNEHLSLRGRIRRQIYLFQLKPGLRYRWSALAGIVQRWYIGIFLGGH